MSHTKNIHAERHADFSLRFQNCILWSTKKTAVCSASWQYSGWQITWKAFCSNLDVLFLSKCLLNSTNLVVTKIAMKICACTHLRWIENFVHAQILDNQPYTTLGISLSLCQWPSHACVLRVNKGTNYIINIASPTSYLHTITWLAIHSTTKLISAPLTYL